MDITHAQTLTCTLPYAALHMLKRHRVLHLTPHRQIGVTIHQTDGSPTDVSEDLSF